MLNFVPVTKHNPKVTVAHLMHVDVLVQLSVGLCDIEQFYILRHLGHTWLLQIMSCYPTCSLGQTIHQSYMYSTGVNCLLIYVRIFFPYQEATIAHLTIIK